MKLIDLGKGTYSKVFTVQNKTNFKIFCCKEIFKSKVVVLLKFKNEINNDSKVDHPNIIKFYEILEEERDFSFIMENCSGEELFQKILEKLSKGETFSEKEAIPIFNQLINAISYFHSQDICHRDLKPENILFLSKRPDSPIKIIDFRLSEIFGEIKPLMMLRLKTI